MSKKKVKTIEYVPDMTFTEIALELNVSQARVMELYSNAMRKLRRKVGYEETIQNG